MSLLLATDSGICNMPYWGPLAFALGSVAFLIGLRAWKAPLPEKLGAILDNIASGGTDNPAWKFLGPVNGSVFIIAGIWVTVLTTQCSNIKMPLPTFSTALAIAPLDGFSYVFIAFACGIGVLNARRLKSWIAKILTVTASTSFGFAAGQAAGFHTGPLAAEWFTICMICAVAAWLFQVLDGFIAGRDD